MFTTTVLLVRLAFSTMVQFVLVFQPSLSTPEILLSFFPIKKAPAVTPGFRTCNFIVPQTQFTP